MPNYQYRCEKCGNEPEVMKPMAESHIAELCNMCNQIMMRVITPCVVHGTRDSFGIDKAFYDTDTNQYIDTWDKWEKAGFTDARKTANPNIQNEVKRKVEKINKFDSGSKFSVAMSHEKGQA